MFDLVGRPQGRVALAATCAIICAAPAYAQESARAFDIPAQPLSSALIAFARQSEQMVLADPAIVNGRQAPQVRGAYLPSQALSALLAGSGLTATPDANGSFVVVDTSSPTQLGAASRTVSSEDGEADLVVTGTRIRGGQPISPLHILGRDEIDRSGFSQIGELMRSLPENFGGGQNPGIINATGTANQNLTNASTINLRGLGTDATLVLLNGRRIPGDAFFQGADISGVPLGAVDRIEIVADGSSALYGSDAVAGVVNIILRDDLDGGAISATWGGATQGGGIEQTYNVMLGATGQRGFLLANAEYVDQDEISAGDLDATSNASPIATLVAPTERQSYYLGAGFYVNDAITLRFDGLYSNRSSLTTSQFYLGDYVGYNGADTETYNLALGADIELGGDWTAHLNAGIAESNNLIVQRIPDFAIVTRVPYNNGVSFAEASFDGVALRLPTGDLNIALGAGVREQTYRQNATTSANHLNRSRDIRFAFLEATAPLVTPDDSRPLLQALELQIAARVEDYSDFGTTTNPKVGLRYTPLDDLHFRTSWSTSFKAPSFQQMYARQMLYLYPSQWFGGPSGSAGMMTWGGNPDLDPETATSWTLGFDYEPEASGMRLSATYFDIDYTDRVVQPVSPYQAALSNPVFAPFVELNPDTVTQAALIAEVAPGAFLNSTGSPYNPANVIAAIYNRYANASSQRVRGLDLSFRQDLDLGIGELTLLANATWMQLEQEIIPGAPARELTGTLENPAEFRLRAGATWSEGAFSATGLVNYISAETDTGVTPNRDIDAWTTVDANIAYIFASPDAADRGVRMSFSLSNLLDEAPPYAFSPALVYEGMNFDSTNASPLGRYARLQISKTW